MSFFLRGSTDPVGQGLLTLHFSQSHSDTPHSVGLLWTSDWSVARSSTWQHTTLQKDTNLWSQGYSNPQSKHARGRRPTP